MYHPFEALLCPKVRAPSAELSNYEAMEAAIELARQNPNGTGRAPRSYGQRVIDGFIKMKGEFDPLEADDLRVIAGLGFLLYMTDQARR